MGVLNNWGRRKSLKLLISRGVLLNGGSENIIKKNWKIDKRPRLLLSTPEYIVAVNYLNYSIYNIYNNIYICNIYIYIYIYIHTYIYTYIYIITTCNEILKLDKKTDLFNHVDLNQNVAFKQKCLDRHNS